MQHATCNMSTCQHATNAAWTALCRVSARGRAWGSGSPVLVQMWHLCASHGRTLHVVCCLLPVARCPCPAYVARRVQPLRMVSCVMRAACCTMQVSCRAVHAICRVLHLARCVLCRNIWISSCDNPRNATPRPSRGVCLFASLFASLFACLIACLLACLPV